MSQAAPSTAPAATAETPYVGLGHFTEDYADRFFGRDSECALIIGNLRASRLTLLYAESGVGKSSVLRAGVVARLRDFADRDMAVRGSPRLAPIVFSSWSERPVESLIRAVGEAVRPYMPENAALDLPRDDLSAAIEVASGALDATLLVILDQFEEYFLYPEHRPESERVAAQVARCVNRPDLRANFLLSVREDAYARLGDLFRGKIQNVYGNFLHLDFLSRTGARESVEKPIERVNELQPEAERLELEPALVDAVLDQVRRGQIASAEEEQDGEAAVGPRDEIEAGYLQLVMRRLWDEETAAGSRRLRLATLEDLGGSQAIIRGHLDRAMEGELDGGVRLSPDQRRVAASIFRFLVTSGGAKIALTAQDLSDLSGLPVAEIEPVLQHLSSPTLHILRPVVSEDGRGESRFEIFHDALARPIVEWRTRVEEAEREAQVKRERAAREEAQEAATEAERREANERRHKRLALALLAGVVVALLAGVAYFAIDKSNLADQRKATAQSVQAAERISELVDAPNFGPTAAALASLEAYRLSPTRETRNQALAALQREPGMPTIAAGHTRSVTAVAYWPGSSKFASGGSDQTVRLWRANGDELGDPLVTSAAVRSIAVSGRMGNGSRVLAAGLENGRVWLCRIGDRGHMTVLSKSRATHPNSTLLLEFDPRAPNLLAVGDDRSLRVWDVSHLRAPAQLAKAHGKGSIHGFAFAPDGSRLLVATDDGGLAWELSDGRPVGKPATVTSGPVNAVATGPDGSYAFGGSRWVEVADADEKQKTRVPVAGPVRSVALARGGSVLASAGADHNVMTWDVASGRPFGPPRAVEPGVVAMVLSPDGKTIAAAGNDGLIRLWPLEPTPVLATTAGGIAWREEHRYAPEIAGLAVGAGGLVAASGDAGGTSIWRLRNGSGRRSAPRPLTRIPGYSRTAAFHGSLLATAKGHSFVIWDTGPHCRRMPTKPCRLVVPAKPYTDTQVESLALEQYGSRLLLASSGEKRGEGVVNLWDVTSANRGDIAHLSTITPRSETEIHHVALSPATPIVAVAALDGKMRVWNIKDPRNPRVTKIKNTRGNEAQPVATVAFSPSGTLLASAGADQQVVLWRVARNGSLVEATPGTLFQTQTIYSLAFSPDGRVLAAGDADGNTCLYEIDGQSRHLIGSCLAGHAVEGSPFGGIMALAFAPVDSETWLLTGGTQQPIVAWDPILWNLSHSDEVDRRIAAAICAQAGRNLTSYEWNAIFASTKIADDRRKTCPRYPLPE